MSRDRNALRSGPGPEQRSSDRRKREPKRRAGSELALHADRSALGLDVLSITTRTKTETMRGTTLGISAQAGFMGRIGDRLMYRASATYIGAIVPGTGDALDGLVFQVGLGWLFDS